MWFVFHLSAWEPFHMHENPSEEEGKDQDQYYKSKHISQGDDHIVKRAENSQHPFSTKQAVNDNFYAANEYNDKSSPYQGMHKSEHRTPENLGLPESHFHHHHETLTPVSYRVRSGKLEEPEYPIHGVGENTQGDKQGNCK